MKESYQLLLNAFKKDVGFVGHQLDSFNDFIEKKIQEIIDEISEIELETPELAEFKVKLGKMRVPMPNIKEADGATRDISPMEARIRDLTYSSPIMVEVIPIVNGVEQDTQEVEIGRLPIMVKSKFCKLYGKTDEELVELGEDPQDPGGYFIINGTEMVIVIVEEVLTNRPVIEKKEEAETARINSEQKGYVQRHLIERRKGLIYISFANLKKLPIVVLFRALGLKTDKDIINIVSDEKMEMEEVYFNLYEFGVDTQAKAVNYIGDRLNIPQKEYRERRVEDVLDKYLLPHIGQSKDDRPTKALFLAKVVRKLIKLGLNRIKEQDIDHYANKRLKMSGDFLEILLRSVLLGKYGLVSRIVYRYQKLAKKGKIPTINSIVESEYLTKRIISHMATGQWIGGRTGVCQRLERNNFSRTIAHLRNLISPLSSAQEHFEARALHSTHWGRLCAEQTPEGVNIGLRKYLAAMALISRDVNEKELKPIIDMIKKEEDGHHSVFLNGKVIKSIKKPEKLAQEIRHKRRCGLINPTINVAVVPEFEEMHINGDAGRLLRPVIVLEHGKSTLTEEHVKKLKKGELDWKGLIKQGIIEYLDAEEEENTLIALEDKDITPEHTHTEIDPSIILGISASLIPFPEHNRGDRVNIGAKMSGQSLGIFSTDFLSRSETRGNILVYPQVPLVTTIFGKEKDMESHPFGQNIIIAVLSFHGYNMEDSIVVNKSSIERGLGRSFFFRTYTTEEQKYWGIEKDEIKIPDKSVNGYRTEEAYANLGKDGIINRETKVESGDVLIGKISPLRFFGPVENFMMESENRRETSETIRHGEDGVVDNVILTQSVDGNKLVKTIVRSDKPPEVGDKFASRHGQKGVISIIIPEDDMPFTEHGITPDLIINPHAIPSRMTIGQLLEILGSKVAALRGAEVDASAFNKDATEENIRELLGKLGFSDDGKEVMYDGISGRRFEGRILIGPCFYQKLHHMVSNKMHSRARGPVALLTKQPTAGKAKQGGLRLGEMEKDCIVGHGAALLLKERFSSDNYEMPVCKKCGLFAVYEYSKGKAYCPLCKKSKIVNIKIAYAFKLMMDEMKSMGMLPKVNVNENGTVRSIEFGFMSPKMIKDIAAVKIEKAELYDPDGYPIDGGLSDLHLGVVDPGLRCRICAGAIGQCLGHFGYLELTKPVVHPLFGKKIYMILRSICQKCSKFLASEDEIKDSKKPLYTAYQKARNKCPHCGEKQKSIKFQKPTSFREGKIELSTEDVRKRLEMMSDDDVKLLGINGGRPEWFIFTILPIPPVTVRPSITLETGSRSEDDLTHKLVDVVRINERLRKNLELGAPEFIIKDIWELLQYHVSTLIDNDISTLPPARHRSGRALKTLVQRISKKEGRFRGNLSGKRVNFSARTVISPDPQISINEVGVPIEIAKELTMSVKVNKYNIEEMKKIIENGPNVHPGANYVIRGDGVRKKITDENKAVIKEELDEGYIVERHLQDGDIALFNRQPSLHRMSIMAHCIRIMDGKTFRLNLCVTVPYNADFDGDEMNLHIPQTEEAQVEAEMLMKVQDHIVSPRCGLPIISCKHDQISGSFFLTRSGTKIDKRTAAELLAEIGMEDVDLNSEYTGKELISLILPKGINVSYKASSTKLGEENLYVSIKDGNLKTGVIDENSIGEMKGKLLNRITRQFPSEEAKNFIDKMSRLSLAVISRVGFSISIDDVDVGSSNYNRIRRIIENAGENAAALIKGYEKGKITHIPGMTDLESLENMIQQINGETTNSAGKIIREVLPLNSSVIMAATGARGSFVNLSQICALVGQESLEGKRIHRGYADRTLPHFKKNDLSMRACGFVDHGYKIGLQPIEFFFDAMNSRENLMDKSLHTRHSGYMERRLINALQDLKVETDRTVRDGKGNIIQFLAGEDGIDPMRTDGGKINLDIIE